MNFIILMIFLAMAVAMLIWPRMLRRSNPAENIARAKERAAERTNARAFADTEPEEDPYDRAYVLSNAMSAVEVDESANGYGMLDDEQKRVIAAIFDSNAQVPSSLDIRPVHGARWSQSVFGELNRVEPIPEKDIWSTIRN